MLRPASYATCRTTGAADCIALHNPRRNNAGKQRRRRGDHVPRGFDDREVRAGDLGMVQ